MKSAQETVSPTRVKLTIEVPFEELKPSLDKAYKTIGSQISVPGFRRGKVPTKVVDQRVGRGTILDQAINDALPGIYSQAVAEAEIQPLGQPEVDVSRLEDGELVEFTVEVDVRPEFETPDLSDVEVTVPDVSVDDSDVDEQVQALRERFATLTEVDRPAADGDFVTIDLSASKDGEKLDVAQASGIVYQVGKDSMLDGLDDAVTGMSAGESTTFQTQLAGGDLKGEDVDVEVTVTTVKEQELPELDDDFAQTASEFDTVDELRADIREKLTRGKRIEQAADARDAVLEAALEKLDVPVPDSVVEAEIASRRQQIEQQLAYAGMTMDAYLESEEQTADEFEADLDKRVRDSLVAQFLLDQVAADSEIGIEQDELTEHMLRRAQQSGEDPQSFMQHMVEHNHIPELVAEVVRGKALAAVVENATVKDESGNVIDLAKLRGDGSFADDEDSAAAEDSDES
ncbi:trigger factor [Mumia sp. zg.B53]|uniref:trigger factor n=1 Tax=unclassified Mumia TaxID=2621872 RepID=UPI001C6E343C|nr:MULTISPECIES: trigger factor [unclassified Mumia]MBW9211162.1 trigger factor [Mumia sp. zg.B21]MBW9215736.1 trigger factor [Mumia sp. zg.B53]MDD9348137.1 trigger factor [Mumia sp.]